MSVSIHDVARLSGVSTATVSRALRGLPKVSEKTRQKVVQAADSLGYVISSTASGLSTGRTNAVGVVVPSINKWFFSSVLEGADQVLRAAGYDLVVYNLGGSDENRERVFSRAMLRERIDAVMILCRALLASEQKVIAELNYPSVVVGGRLDGCVSVSIDDAQACRKAVDYLASLGHRRIAFIGGDVEDETSFSVASARNSGFAAAMAAAGLAVDPALTARTSFTIAGGSRAMERILSAGVPRPTAVFAACDEMAFGAITAARRNGLRVPEDLSVVGLDNHEAAEALGLTTVSQDPAGQGATAARILLSALDGSAPDAGWIVAPNELIVRSSASPVRTD
ncbi:LacI family transcriptional regulator [Paenarthrobacter sp. DKR-5]|uniref:LacI family DNA-binding transcriptional regulator n=1 Tax=Paenarthrobacter sp. DKR-5 TaxID=2835535 RepID=UPI001BDD29B1|nr:LacI family DNA-binding transcriptional regulator [Paenarthrobacter sp. DKR-5]MBT1003456.1 LacI family transcriptional regulator [Paenarthrobacter sp. DKR-5]